MEGVVSLKSFYKDKVVLITGDSGFKGSWLATILSSFGAKVVGFSLKPNTNPNLFTIRNLSKTIHHIDGDIRDFAALISVVEEFKPEIVFHLAAQPIVLTSYKDPKYTYETNVMGTVNLLESIRRVGCVISFLNITTDKVYENNGRVHHPFSEEEKLDGYDPYSNSKSCSELVTHSYKKCFFEGTSTAVSTARAGNVIGGGDFSDFRIIPDSFRAITSDQPVGVRNKESIRPYQFVLEPLCAYLLIAMRQYLRKSTSGFFNVGPDHCDAITTGKLVSLFCDAWGGNASWKDRSLQNAKHEAEFLELDNSLIKEKMGWHPKMHIEEAILWTAEWYKAFFSGGDDEANKVMDRQISSYFDGVCL